MAALKTVYQRGEKSGRIFGSEKTGQALENWWHWIGKQGRRRGSPTPRAPFAALLCPKLRVKGAKLEDTSELLGTRVSYDETVRTFGSESGA
jgi:hypothetical protein